VPYENAKAIYRIYKRQNRAEKIIVRRGKARNKKVLKSRGDPIPAKTRAKVKQPTRKAISGKKKR
jgi:hypothetical protein